RSSTNSISGSANLIRERPLGRGARAEPSFGSGSQLLIMVARVAITVGSISCTLTSPMNLVRDAGGNMAFGSAHNMHSLHAKIIRGGSSKGIYIDVADLPPEGAARDKIIL